MGHAAVRGDSKPKFLRSMADWIESWTNEKIPCTQKFTFSAQTSAALTRTLRGQAQLIEDLLNDGFEFVLTARFQSDPLERRFGQYRQMSGGRLLVSLKDTEVSEKILKIMSLIKEGVDIDASVKEEKPDLSLEQSLINDPLVSDLSIDRLLLDAQTRKVGVHIAGLIAKHFGENKQYWCCKKALTGVLSESNPDHSYIRSLNRGGLTIPSAHLTEFICTIFAILDYTQVLIRSSQLTERRAAIVILNHVATKDRGSFPRFTCGKQWHYQAICSYANRVITNIYLNNRRKILTGSVVKDKVASFKKTKRTKDEK